MLASTSSGLSFQEVDVGWLDPGPAVTVVGVAEMAQLVEDQGQPAGRRVGRVLQDDDAAPVPAEAGPWKAPGSLSAMTGTPMAAAYFRAASSRASESGRP